MSRLIALVALALTFQAHAFCFQDAGRRYHIDPLLLRSIAMQESGLNPHAINQNRNRKGAVTSTDYGLMQINSVHVPELKRLGIIHSSRELLDNACLNVEVGAWILAKAFQVCDVNWRCLGAYNAGFKKDNPNRLKYARRVFTIYRKLKGMP
ncbi:lytic transglycosylase domain-containing protein [Scandinavium goeteborgense]|uniref:lytic transglycosylase domain-containing protein n=1 Tax=Scandinavium goeteborgense TaxID=1851514 RepID=UPI00380DC33E